MSTKRIRRPVYNDYGVIVGSVNADDDLGPANGRTSRISMSSAAPVGHMNPGKQMRGITHIQQAGLYEKNQRFNGPIAPEKK